MKIVCDFCGVSIETYKDNKCPKGQPGTYARLGEGKRVELRKLSLYPIHFTSFHRLHLRK